VGSGGREYADAGNRYQGIYLTPEVIAYNSDVVTRRRTRATGTTCSTRAGGQVLIRDPLASGTMRTIFGMFVQRSIRETGSPDAGFEWLRRLDGQTKEYVLNPTLLYQKLARQEGLVTLWDMPDIEMLKARTGYPIDYVFPSSGTPVVVDAIALVRGGRNPEAARAFIEFVGSQENGPLRRARAFPPPARNDVPADSLPPLLRGRRSGSWRSRWTGSCCSSRARPGCGTGTSTSAARVDAASGITHKRFGETTAVSELSAGGQEGRVPQPSRPERVRQDDDAADDRRLRAAGRGAHPSRGSRHHAPAPQRRGPAWSSRATRSSRT
jgi:hypothetical protein